MIKKYSKSVLHKESDLFLSRNGTGAGRPTGGPAFNITFEQILARLFEVVHPANTSVYADEKIMNSCC